MNSDIIKTRISEIH